MTDRLRQSVPTSELERYWYCGWAYVMPDFDKPNHSWIEWLSDNLPVYPANRVPPTHTERGDHERATSGA